MGLTGFGQAISMIVVWCLLDACGVNAGSLKLLVMCNAFATIPASILFMLLSNTCKYGHLGLIFPMIICYNLATPIGAFLIVRLNNHVLMLVVALTLILVSILQNFMPLIVRKIRNLKEKRLICDATRQVCGINQNNNNLMPVSVQKVRNLMEGECFSDRKFCSDLSEIDSGTNLDQPNSKKCQENNIKLKLEQSRDRGNSGKIEIDKGFNSIEQKSSNIKKLICEDKKNTLIVLPGNQDSAEIEKIQNSTVDLNDTLHFVEQNNNSQFKSKKIEQENCNSRDKSTGQNGQNKSIKEKKGNFSIGDEILNGVFVGKKNFDDEPKISKFSEISCENNSLPKSQGEKSQCNNYNSDFLIQNRNLNRGEIQSYNSRKINICNNQYYYNFSENNTTQNQCDVINITENLRDQNLQVIEIQSQNSLENFKHQNSFQKVALIFHKTRTTILTVLKIFWYVLRGNTVYRKNKNDKNVAVIFQFQQLFFYDSNSLNDDNIYDDFKNQINNNNNKNFSQNDNIFEHKVFDNLNQPLLLNHQQEHFQQNSIQNECQVNNNQKQIGTINYSQLIQSNLFNCCTQNHTNQNESKYDTNQSQLFQNQQQINQFNSTTATQNNNNIIINTNQNQVNYGSNQSQLIQEQQQQTNQINHCYYNNTDQTTNFNQMQYDSNYSQFIQKQQQQQQQKYERKFSDFLTVTFTQGYLTGLKYIILCSFFAGFTGSMLGIGGPPFMIMTQILDIPSFQSTASQSTLAFFNYTTFEYIASGLFQIQDIKLYLAYLLGVIIGLILGSLGSAKISQKWFKRVLTILVVVSAVVLICQAFEIIPKRKLK